MPISASGVDSNDAVTQASESALDTVLATVPFSNIQHSIKEFERAVPEHIVCSCEASASDGILHTLQPDVMWLACHWRGQWTYGRCQCERIDETMGALESQQLVNRIPQSGIETSDLIVFNDKPKPEKLCRHHRIASMLILLFVI